LRESGWIIKLGFRVCRKVIIRCNEDLGVYHYEAPEAIRTAILFHIANWQKNVRGCIGLGFGLGGSWNVTDSADATNHFLAMLAQESEHLLEIT